MDIAKLALEDGTVFTGTAFGARGEVDGEVVFNTSMTGYQEILTDPSYHGQIVAMTYPQIGNYGVNDDDAESRRPWVRGFVVRELSGRVSNFRADGSLESYLERNGIIGDRGDRHPRPGPPDARARGAEGHPLDDRPRRRQPGGQGQGQPRPGRPRPGARGHARRASRRGTAGWTPPIAWSRRAGDPANRPIRPATRRMLDARTSSRSISG